MRESLRVLLLLAAGVIVSSCEAPHDSPAFPGPALTAEDQRIAALLYGGASRTPAGFGAADITSDAAVTTLHLKSNEIAGAGASSFELCTDDWNEAFAWTDEVAAQSPELLDFVANDATDRYFEFDRMPRDEPHRYVRIRVFRCEYLDRTGAETRAPAGFAGVLNTRPLDADVLRELSEYLWFFTPYNEPGHVVLASAARPASQLSHALTIASLEPAARGVCDRVVVRDWTHTAQAATGALEVAITAARDFFVRREGDHIVGC